MLPVPTRPPRPRRRWLRRLLAVLLPVALLAGGWLALPRVLERLIAADMAADAGEPVRLRVAELSLSGLVMAPLVLGDDLYAERVAVRWRLAGLAQRRLEQVTLSGVRARARFDAGGLSLGAVDRLIETQHMAVGRLALPDAVATVAVPWGERRVSFAADKQAGVITARGDLSDLLRGQPVLDGGAVLLEMTARRLESGGMSAEMSLSGGPLSGRLALQWAKGRLRAVLEAPLALSLAAVPPDIAAAVPPELRPLLAGPLTMTVQPGGAGPALQVDGRDLAAAVRAELTAGGETRVVLDLAGAGRIDDDGLPQRLDLERLAVEVAGLPYGETRINGALRLADLSGARSGGAARLRLMLLARRLAAAGVTADEVALALTGRLELQDGTLTYALGEAGSLYIKGARAPGLSIDQPLRLAIAADGRVRLSLRPDAWDLAPGLSLSLPGLSGEAGGQAFRVGPVTAALGGRVSLSQPLPELDVRADFAALPGLDLTLRQVTARLEQTGAGPRLAFAAAEARRGAALPLALAGWLQPQDGRLAFSASLNDALQRVTLTAGGRHDPVSGSGQAELSLRPVTFRPGGLQPRSLVPELPQPAAGVTGSLAISGRLAWTRDSLRPDLDVLIKDIDTQVGDVALRKINSVVKLTGLSPPASPPGQLLAVGLIDAGLPLTDGQVQFHLVGGRLVIERAKIDLAGGVLSMGGLEFDPKARQPQRFSLEVSGVDLGLLVKQADLDGLTATGRLAGNVPLALSGDHVLIEDARLISVDAGAVRYRPKKPPALFDANESTRLVLKAFDNFEYDKLTMTLNGTIGGELTASMHITGSNPSLYGGYPIEFNLSLGGKLDRIIDDALIGYQIPDQIKQRMSWFGAR